MPRRYYTRGKKTYAKGQKDRIKGNRFMSTISLVSLKVEDVSEANPLDRTGEFYFEVDDEGLLSGKKVRMPQHGEIHIEENRTFTPKQPFTLWFEFEETEDEKTKQIQIELKEKDAAHDDKIFKLKIPLVIGSGTKYEVLRGKQIKAKVKITSALTRF